MAGKASIALFLAVNLVVLSVATACGGGCLPPATPTPSTPTPSTPTPSTPTPSTPTPSTPTPSTPTPTPASFGRCPLDALKLGVCVNVLGVVKGQLGAPPTLPCCSLLNGLVDLEAAVCLCTVLKANVLGINLNLPINLSLILNNCGKKVPTGFMCY